MERRTIQRVERRGKKNPEKVGKLHITEDSFTFDFSNKNNKN